MPQPKARLLDKVIVITGGSRGIGRAIAVRAAQEGARLVLIARDASGQALSEAAAEVAAAGSEAITMATDVSDGRAMQSAIDAAMQRFGGIDALINNAGAVHLGDVRHTSLERFSSLLDVNLRGAYEACRLCLNQLTLSDNPHILNLAPPLNMNPRWFRTHTPYTISKYALSLLTKGLAEELSESRIAVNALWPRTVIYTGADDRMLGVAPENCRTPAFVAAAAVEILSRPADSCRGEFFSDEEVMRQIGVTDFKPYAIAGGQPLMADFFVD